MTTTNGKSNATLPSPAQLPNAEQPKPVAAIVRLAPPPIEHENRLTVRDIFGNMDATFRFAQALCQGSGQGKDTEAFTGSLAKIIVGAELGIGPAASVRGIYFVKGRLSLSADLMVALARDEGWDFKVEHSNPPGSSCTVTAIRDGSQPYAFTWTMDMAKGAGLSGGDNYKKYPWDMLYARCVSHVARKVAPGRLMGIYTPDELETRREPVEGNADALLQSAIKGAEEITQTGFKAGTEAATGRTEGDVTDALFSESDERTPREHLDEIDAAMADQ